jgi:glucan biosynthesis protein C
MSPAVHGAFLLHPPVIVGLALAVQGLPVPAEVRFVLVLAGGVTASFGLAAAARRRRRPDFAPV